MLLMSWMVARLGSRFSLVFEPYRRRVMHSALGRFLDQPMDLMVGLVQPDGVERVLPFTKRGCDLFCCEQFERMNSITFRGYSEQYRLCFEFNIHSVFYPQDEALCTMPAFYLEMRISPTQRVRWIQPQGPTPDTVKLFIRLQRADTLISTGENQGSARIDLAYHNSLTPQFEHGRLTGSGVSCEFYRSVEVHERIVSLNPDCGCDDDGQGLSIDLPVTEMGSGIKWRLVWAAHCGEPVLQIGDGEQARHGRFRYAGRLADVDAVVADALGHRDDRLAHSRRFEKLFDQAPMHMAQRHLVHLAYQTFLGNTFWCNLHHKHDGSSAGEWFSVWEGRYALHSVLDVEYNVSLFYLALWPQLLGMQFGQWADHTVDHKPSAGCYLAHDLGLGCRLTQCGYHHPLPVEENADFLLMLQAFTHWTGKLHAAEAHGELIERLLRYLVWADPSYRASDNTIDDAGPALQSARGQTYLRTKRLAAIAAAGDLLRLIGRGQPAQQCDAIVQHDAALIEQQAWLGDHYAVTSDPTTTDLTDAWTGRLLTYDKLPGHDAYSIYTGNGLLLPAMIGQPWLLDQERLRRDLTNATRETLSHYGCGHSSHESENVRISQNIWRDHLACYLGLPRPHVTQRYWDLQVMGNTGQQSNCFVDAYISNDLSFHPRGVTAIGFLMAQVRLIIDRLAPGGLRISVEPDCHVPQRWPLLPLADWKAGKIPVCVVDADGLVTIENESDPIIVHGIGAHDAVRADELIG